MTTALEALSAIYESKKKPEEFQSYLKTLIETGADNAPYAYYVDASKKEGKNEEATTTLQQLSEKHPDSAPISSALAGLYKDTGAIDKATSIYNKLIEKNENDSGALHSLGDIYAQSGQDEKAAEHYAKSLKLWPFDPALQGKLGDAYARLGKKDDAIAAYKQALGMNPNDQGLSDKLKALEQADKAPSDAPPAEQSPETAADSKGSDE